MGDKFKSGASNLFSKTKTEIARTKQKAMVKMGRAEETVDVNYNNELARFAETKKVIKKVKTDSVKLLELLKEVSLVQASLAEDFYELSESKHELYNAALKYQDIAKSCDNARIQFDEQLRADTIEPISKYLGQYKEIKQRIAEDKVRKVDMDRYQRDVRTTTEKAKSGVNQKEQKHETSRVNYNNLHEELLRDLPLLHEDRLVFLNPVFSTYLTGLSDYYRNAAKSTAESLPLVNHINRSVVHDHVRVTTSNENTYHKSKLSVHDDIPHSTHNSSTNNLHNTNNQSGVNPHSNLHTQPQPNHQPSTNPHVVNSTLPINHQQPDYHANQLQQHQQQQAMGNASTTGRAMPTLPTKNVPVTGPKVVKAQALYEFNAQESNELSFQIGDTIIIHKQTGDWWEGELNGKKGLLPSNYVQLC